MISHIIDKQSRWLADCIILLSAIQTKIGSIEVAEKIVAEMAKYYTAKSIAIKSCWIIHCAFIFKLEYINLYISSMYARYFPIGSHESHLQNISYSRLYVCVPPKMNSFLWNLKLTNMDSKSHLEQWHVLHIHVLFEIFTFVMSLL